MTRCLLYLLALLFLTAPCIGAEFVVMAKNSPMAQAVIDGNTAGWTADEIAEADKQYKIGDIVDVFPDGRLTDSMRSGGLFYIIRVSGLPYETAKKYMTQHNEDYIDNGVSRTRMISRRLYRVRLSSLPVSVRNALQKTGVYNTTLSAVRSYIMNKKTGLGE